MKALMRFAGAGLALAAVLLAAAVPAPAQTSRPTSAPASAPKATVPPDAAIGPAAAMDLGANQVVKAMQDAMGGYPAFEKVRTIRFTFAVTSRDTLRVARTLWWDRENNRVRVEGKDRKGQPYVLVVSTATRNGDGWLNGQKLAGDEAKTWMTRAYSIWINDTYWLLMPWKLFDPGVKLASDGEAVVNGSPHDRIKVTFASVGLTPGDTYWAYIDRKSHVMDRWGFILQDSKGKPDAKETNYDWVGWNDFGGIRLATKKVQVDDPNHTMIECKDLSVDQAFDPKTFSDPAPLAH